MIDTDILRRVRFDDVRTGMTLYAISAPDYEGDLVVIDKFKVLGRSYDSVTDGDVIQVRFSRRRELDQRTVNLSGEYDLCGESEFNGDYIGVFATKLEAEIGRVFELARREEAKRDELFSALAAATRERDKWVEKLGKLIGWRSTVPRAAQSRTKKSKSKKG